MKREKRRHEAALEGEEEQMGMDERLDEERKKRWKIEDDVEALRRGVDHLQIKVDKTAKALGKVLGTMQREAELKDSKVIMIVKKKAMSMREFYTSFEKFQEFLAKDEKVLEIASAGPLWQVTTRMPTQTQATFDKIKSWAREKHSDGIAAFRGKTAITTVRQNDAKIAHNSAIEALGLPFGRDSGLATAWHDREGK